MPQRQLLLVLSAPSGAGKTTLCDQLLQLYPEFTYSISVTTRPPRGCEVDGEDYHFVTEDSFRQRIGRNEFLEHACVHSYCYGSLKAPVYDAFREGHSVLMDIDTAGAERVRNYCRVCPAADPLRNRLVDIFILPPSMETLRERLETRREDSPASMARRLRNAEAEIGEAPKFRYRVVNENLRHALTELSDIIEMERSGPAPVRRETQP